MIALLQRVSSASVSVDEQLIAEIKMGLLILLGVQVGDSVTNADALAKKVRNFRLFSDNSDKMNWSVSDAKGAVLAVPQFTLAADTSSGRRPGFSTAARPELAEPLFDRFVAELAGSGLVVKTGVFGANMQVSLTNDGPVTFLLNNSPDSD